MPGQRWKPTRCLLLLVLLALLRDKSIQLVGHGIHGFAVAWLCRAMEDDDAAQADLPDAVPLDQPSLDTARRDGTGNVEAAAGRREIGSDMSEESVCGVLNAFTRALLALSRHYVG